MPRRCGLTSVFPGSAGVPPASRAKRATSTATVGPTPLPKPFCGAAARPKRHATPSSPSSPQTTPPQFPSSARCSAPAGLCGRLGRAADGSHTLCRLPVRLRTCSGQPRYRAPDAQPRGLVATLSQSDLTVAPSRARLWGRCDSRRGITGSAGSDSRDRISSRSCAKIVRYVFRTVGSEIALNSVYPP